MDEADNSDTAITGVGGRLRAAREAAGLTLTDIAGRTRVNARHLGAIERGDLADLPAAPYSVGFVKAYARAVGLDGAALGAEFRREWDLGGAPAAETVRYEPVDPTRLPSRMLAWTAALIALVIVVSYAVWRSGVMSGDTADRRAQAAAGTDAPRPAPPPAATATVPPAPTPPVAAAPATGPVLLTATQPAWIKVYERGGAVLFQGELTQGQTYEVPATAVDPLIRLGRAEALTVSVAGRPTAPLGPAGRTVKDVSLKAAALLARPAAPAAAPAATPL